MQHACSTIKSTKQKSVQSVRHPSTSIDLIIAIALGRESVLNNFLDRSRLFWHYCTRTYTIMGANKQFQFWLPLISALISNRLLGSRCRRMWLCVCVVCTVSSELFHLWLPDFFCYSSRSRVLCTAR